MKLANIPIPRTLSALCLWFGCSAMFINDDGLSMNITSIHENPQWYLHLAFIFYKQVFLAMSFFYVLVYAPQTAITDMNVKVR